MAKKYSKNFERDYAFYLKNIEHFNFSGTRMPRHKAIYSKDGVTAKQAFHSIESDGKNIPTKEPQLLDQLLLTKASVNFHIKQKKLFNIEDKNDAHLTYRASIAKIYDLPEWAIMATEKQKEKTWHDQL